MRPGDTTAEWGLSRHLLPNGDPTLKGESEVPLDDPSEKDVDFSGGGCGLPDRGNDPCETGDVSILPSVDDRGGVLCVPILSRRCLS